MEEVPTPTMNILIIDDDASLRRTLRMSLEVLGHRAVEARDGAQALELLGRQPFEMALLDLRLAREQGLDLLPCLLGLAPGLQVVIVTAYATIETAVEAMRRGAFDYLPKPFTPDQLRLILDRIARLRRLQSQVDQLQEQVREAILRYPWPGNIRELRNAIERGVILAAGPLLAMTDLPLQIGNPNQAGAGADRQAGAAGEPLTLDQIEVQHIRRIMASTATMEKAATTLGIDPSTLYRKRKKYGI
jgi:DNA-binding NtrC family response regulator